MPEELAAYRSELMALRELCAAMYAEAFPQSQSKLV